MKFRWAGIGYNYFIEGQGLHVGVQAYGFNKISIGIGLPDDFNLTFPTDEQMTSFILLTTKIMQEYSITLDNIVGHKELENQKTTCPGDNFDLFSFRKLFS